MQINKTEMRRIKNALYFFAMIVEDKQPKVGEKYRLLAERFPTSASLLTPLAPDRLAVDGLGEIPLQSSEKAEVSPAKHGGR
jgi:hypothetical protein